MCKWVKSGANRIDPCIRETIETLNGYFSKTKILACCCGHGRYPKTVVVRDKDGIIREINSGQVIPRKRRFYKRDPDGRFYIPEVSR